MKYKKFLSFLLTLSLLASMFTGMGITAFAENATYAVTLAFLNGTVSLTNGSANPTNATAGDTISITHEVDGAESIAINITGLPATAAASNMTYANGVWSASLAAGETCSVTLPAYCYATSTEASGSVYTIGCAADPGDITIDQTSMTLPVGETGEIKSTITPDYCTNISIKLEIDASGSDIVGVSQNGLTTSVTAKKPGTAHVTVIASSNFGTCSRTCEVIVVKAIGNTTVAAIDDQTYTGSEIRPEVTVKDGDTTLIKGQDYSLTYADNINVGTATITIKGQESYGYGGTKTVNFNIVTYNNVTISSASNGTVTADKTNPVKSGGTVTLTVNPSDGYILESLSVIDASGNGISTNQLNNSYTFTMPASAVTVSATFKKPIARTTIASIADQTLQEKEK